MKTKGRPCKIGVKQTGFCAEMTRILQKKAAFFVLFEPRERILAHKTGELARRPCRLEILKCEK
jgi:hypothetical protein